MPNPPDYLAVWLGPTRMGGATALPDTNLTGPALAHGLAAAAASHLIADAELAVALSDRALLIHTLGAMAVALFATHGVQPAGGPAAVRAALEIQAAGAPSSAGRLTTFALAGFSDAFSAPTP